MNFPLQTGRAIRFFDRLLLRRIELRSGQPLTWDKIAIEEQVMPRSCNPIHVFEILIDADPNAVLRIVESDCHPRASLQLWDRGVIYLACALQIKDRMAGWSAPLSG